MTKTPSYVEEFIEEHFDDVGYPYECLTLEDWQEDFSDCIYGWKYPDDVGEEFLFCPEILASHIANQDDEAAQHYLEVTLYFCDRHITLMVQKPNLDALGRQHSIESDMYEEWGESLEIINEIQLQALEM